jgi:FMN phosphatase YigB (HAD superfamily)
MTQQKLILIDADGVLFDWEWVFDRFVQTRGYEMRSGGKDQYLIHQRYECDEPTGRTLIKDFNESPAIAFLPPLRDSVEYVTRLRSEGWHFHCVTSLSKLKSAEEFRRQALDRAFGSGTIEQLTCLSTGADKDQALEPFRDSGLWWIEDKPENADVGHRLGLRSILVKHGHNVDHQCPYPKVDNWQQIYALITS